MLGEMHGGDLEERIGNESGQPSAVRYHFQVSAWGGVFREESQSHIKVVWSQERAVLLHQHARVKERKLMGTAAAGPVIRP